MQVNPPPGSSDAPIATDGPVATPDAPLVADALAVDASQPDGSQPDSPLTDAALPDAAIPDGAPDAREIPDATGSFLFSIFVSLFPQAAPLETIATMTVHQTQPPRVDLHIQWLTYTDHALIDRLQADFPGQAVDETGTFIVAVPTLTIPGEAGFLGSDTSAVNVSIVGTIKTKDFLCGTVDGTALTASLTGSTFGAIRVASAQTGSQLPAPVASCTALVDGGI